MRYWLLMFATVTLSTSAMASEPSKGLKLSPTQIEMIEGIDAELGEITISDEDFNALVQFNENKHLQKQGFEAIFREINDRLEKVGAPERISIRQSLAEHYARCIDHFLTSAMDEGKEIDDAERKAVVSWIVGQAKPEQGVKQQLVMLWLGSGIMCESYSSAKFNQTLIALDQKYQIDY